MMGVVEKSQSIAAIGSWDRVEISSSRKFLLAASAVAMVTVMGSLMSAAPALAQAGQADSQLPPVNVTAPSETSHSTTSASSKRAGGGSQRTRRQAARQTEQAPPKQFMQTQAERTGTVGYYSNSTSVATRTNTPIINLPQSLNVITRDFIRDQNQQ